jgi:3-carboxy-cis,cis-muconate cycloisomerase
MTPRCDHDSLQALLDVEVALAVAEAQVGIIPAGCVADIQAAARADAYDRDALAASAINDGNLVIPLVKKLTAAVAARNPESARYVHRGATSQDILDTALVLQLRAATVTVHDQLTRAMTSAAALARQYAMTPIAGRTWLQQASPTTFGLKAAGWLDMLGRCRARGDRAMEQALVVQLGGASGTLASLGKDGPAVTAAMANHLKLRIPEMPWHTHRDRVAEVSASFGITCGALGKVGRDLTLLAQSEVAEAFEDPASAGGSSSMPHKQNPVRAVSAVTAAVCAPALVATMLAAMPQEHERAAGGWQAEWATLADLTQLTCGAAHAIADALAGLRVDPRRMRENLETRGGVAMAEGLSTALMTHISRQEAMTHVERLARAADRDRRSLRDVATADQEISRWLSRDDIDRALTPENFLGSAGAFVERVLQHWAM